MVGLANSQKLIFEALIENLPLAIFLKDVRDDFRVTLWNKAAEQIFGIDRKDILGKNAHDLWPKAQADAYLVDDLRATRSNQPIEVAEEISQKGAGQIYLRTKKIPLSFSTNSEVEYLLCVCEDITEQKAITDEKRKLLRQLEDAQSIAKIGSWNFNLDTHNLHWSKEHYAIFEIEYPQPPERLYELYRARIHREDLAKLDQLLAKTLATGEGFIFDHRLVFPDGRIKYVQGIARVSFDKSGQPTMISGTCQDQSESREVQFRFDQMANVIEEVFWMSDPEKSKIAFISAGYEKIWGRSVTELYERPLAFAEAIHPEDRAKVIAALSKQASGEYNETYRVIRPDGQMRWIHDRAYPVKDDDQNVTRIVGLAQDITDEVAARAALDLERAKSLQSAKLASLGELSASIAHEINNPLAVISGTLSIIEKFKNDPVVISEKLEKANRATERIVKIVSGLRKFTRTSTELQHEVKDLEAILQESITLIESRLRQNNIKIHLDLQSNVKVLCSEVEIEQVILNLLNNSIDAVKDRTEKWIKVELFKSDNHAVLRILDSGAGISKAVESRLFEPFYTTKPVGEGTGLGLSISKGILEQHKASIAIDHSSTNTCFQIDFPPPEIENQCQT